MACCPLVVPFSLPSLRTLLLDQFLTSYLSREQPDQPVPSTSYRMTKGFVSTVDPTVGSAARVEAYGTVLRGRWLIDLLLASGLSFLSGHCMAEAISAHRRILSSPPHLGILPLPSSTAEYLSLAHHLPQGSHGHIFSCVLCTDSLFSFAK